jgi:ribose/xylose/arabinose/galactoside ABC-type transport system permease subunit
MIQGQRATRAATPTVSVPSILQSFGILLILCLLVVVFWRLAPVFLSAANLANILIQVAVVGVASVGETLVMLIGGVDLSVGSVVLLSSVVMAGLVTNSGTPPLLAIPLGLLAGGGVGLVNGLLVAYLGVESIIVTLGTLLAASGLGQLLLNNNWIEVTNPVFLQTASAGPLGLPVMVYILLGVYALMALVMAKTTFGRTVYEIGGNARAARLLGIPTRAYVVAVFALAGLFAGVGGFLEIGQLGLVSQTDGSGMEFSAIAAVLIGGLSLQQGGVGRVEKTFLGVLVVGVITNFLTIKGVSGTYQQAVLGALVLAAVLFDQVLRRLRIG